MKNTKFYIIISLIIIILAMSFGYSALTSKITLNGVAGIIGEWDVRITNVKIQSISDGCDAGIPQFTDTTVTLDSKLIRPGDIVTYLITIKNAGTLDASLSTVIFMETSGSETINYTTTELKPELKPGESTEFTVKVEYVKNANETPPIKNESIIGIIEYVQEKGI